MQVGEGALYAPALAAQTGAVLGAAPSDRRLHAEIPDRAAVLVVVAAAADPGTARRRCRGRPRLPLSRWPRTVCRWLR
ncbi:hypothetical protein C0Q57_05970 [Streptomyces albidoflavus]|nr:hypothetical protein C0Q57_05970 [Streptomyces albidoflavus]